MKRNRRFTHMQPFKRRIDVISFKNRVPIICPSDSDLCYFQNFNHQRAKSKNIFFSSIWATFLIDMTTSCKHNKSYELWTIVNIKQSV